MTGRRCPIPAKGKDIITDAPWLALTRKVIGIAMELHNELGPGHREHVYQRAMEVKLAQAGIKFVAEPYIPITLDDGTEVGADSPDLWVEETVIVENKAHFFTMSKDDEAQTLSYFAVFEKSPVALYFNFGRPRLEWHRLLPPKSIRAYRMKKWGKKE